VSKATVICAVLLASCVHVLLARPYLEADAWMGWVRALLLMDSVGITLINAVAAMADIGVGAESATASMEAGSLCPLLHVCAYGRGSYRWIQLACVPGCWVGAAGYRRSGQGGC